MQAACQLRADKTGVVVIELVACQVPDVEDVERAIGVGGNFGVVDVQAEVVQRTGDSVQQANPIRSTDFDQAENLRAFVVDFDTDRPATLRSGRRRQQVS